MTRVKKIGYFHAALTVAWFSTLALDRHQIVKGVLGDVGCTSISWFFGLPLSWLAALIMGFPSMPEHFIRMSLIGAAVIGNGLVVGYCIDRILSRAGMLDRNKQIQKMKQAEQAVAPNRSLSSSLNSTSSVRGSED